MTTADILRRFSQVQQNGDGWIGLCPAHADRNPSLSIKTGNDGRTLLHCHAGCQPDAVLRAAGLTRTDLFESNGHTSTNGQIVATYDYRDENSTLLYQVVRFDPKNFRQRQPKPGGGWAWSVKDVRKVLYRLPDVLAADPKRTVFVVEGEKDANRLADLGLVATTNVGGAGKWRPEYNEHFRGRGVVVIADNDDPGRDHAQKVSQSLHGIAASIKILSLPGLPEHGDVSDWIKAGGSAMKLRRYARYLPDWSPATSTGDLSPAFTRLLTGRELLALNATPRFLIRNVLVGGQPAIVGGRSKTMKTSVACDLVVSLGSGTPFLGKFDSQRVNVGFWSGESGAAVVRETAQRIASAKGVSLADCSVSWCFDLPKLCRPDHLDLFCKTIEQHKLQVAVVDPLYLSLLQCRDSRPSGQLVCDGCCFGTADPTIARGWMHLDCLASFPQGWPAE